MTIAASSPGAGRPNHRLKGILFLCFGASIFSLQDVVVKSVSGGYPVAEVLAIRCIVAYLPLFAFLAYDGGLRALRTGRFGWMILRSVFLFLAYTTYYLALAALPMSTATALFFSAPLFIVALSGPLLKEHAATRAMAGGAGGIWWRADRLAAGGGDLRAGGAVLSRLRGHSTASPRSCRGCWVRPPPPRSWRSIRTR